MEVLIDRSIDSSDVGGLASLLAALTVADPRMHARAVEILLTPERVGLVAERLMRSHPSSWIGLLRQPDVARSVLSRIRQSDWTEFWACLPPEFPQWSRSLLALLRSHGFDGLRQAPAEYILLGTGPEQWSRRKVSLRELSNALYARDALSDGVTLHFLESIQATALIDAKYRKAKFWLIVDFLRAMYFEQPRVILRKMTTSTLTERVVRSGEIGWSSPDLYDQIGFVALVGALSLAGVDLRLPLDLRGMADKQEITEISEGHPEGQLFVDAGLRRLALA